MKNLLVFITPEKKFFGEYAVLSKVLVDNGFDLGWKPDDIMVVTNFPWEYNGVKAIEVGDEHFCPSRPRSIKTSIIPYLVEEGLVQEGKLYWNHDLDAFQMNHFDLELAPEVDIGLTDYGWKPRWCMGSYFFKKSARDFFMLANPVIHSNIEDEEAFLRLEEANTHNFKARHSRLNITYNFGMRRVEDNYRRADQPLKVVHFHPTYKRERTWDVFVHGKNGLDMPLVSERLVKVFNHHGIK